MVPTPETCMVSEAAVTAPSASHHIVISWPDTVEVPTTSDPAAEAVTELVAVAEETSNPAGKINRIRDSISVEEATTKLAV